LTRGQRLSRDADAIASGDPKRVVRRLRNRVVGRLLGRIGFWRRLWK
jgi:hypothetical protein